MQCPKLAKNYRVITPRNMHSLLPSTYRRTPGTRVTLSCLVPTAYQLIGHSLLTCQRNGQWDYPIPKCVEKDALLHKGSTTVSPLPKQAASLEQNDSKSGVDGVEIPYIISVCVLAVMFLCLILMMTYLVRMRKSIDRKIETLDRRPPYVKAVESLRSIQSLSSGAYDYFRRPHSPTSASSSHSSSNEGRLQRHEESDRGQYLTVYSDKWPG